MPNFTRTQLTGVWTGGGYTVLPADMASLDAKQFKMLNGDRGGAHGCLRSEATSSIEPR